jgi:hypothetical protein
MHRDDKRAVYLDMALEVIARGEEVPLKAAGLSMGGTIRSGEWIVVKQCAAAALRRGDVVLYRRGAVLVCHRVVRITDRHGTRLVVTKGDGHFRGDEPVPADRVVARVVAIRKAHSTLRLDRGWGRLFTHLLTAYSQCVWGLYRLTHPRHRPPAPQLTPFGRAFRRLMRWPTTALAWFWKRVGR